MGNYTFEVVPGFFIQDDPSSQSFAPVPPRFGLIDASPQRWINLFGQIRKLNLSTGHGTSYKLFFFARHGEGYHNVAEAKYGTQAWDDYWSKLNGDGELVWGPDPELTPLGISQAEEVRDVLEEELAAKLHLPSKLYSSPFTRALNTCQIQWENILISDTNTVSVLEDCRETIGVHTCDKRRTRSYIESRFEGFIPEPSMTEEDELWTPDYRETHNEIVTRTTRVLHQVFDEEPGNFISVTAHGGVINAFMASLGRSDANLPTGGLMPVVVKATRL
ncbi:phosphoglycerate mutase [Pluteus cervinus]|uniref:Phosphoglycerate mutase n=1 Tax=Pluteus cervinus TaxID=181527 RepID=A0ACD3ABP0_9AGAR|nr:phosphoglycerate mutase [Pluteus cervinus]